MNLRKRKLEIDGRAGGTETIREKTMDKCADFGVTGLSDQLGYHCLDCGFVHGSDHREVASEDYSKTLGRAPTIETSIWHPALRLWHFRLQSKVHPAL
jgi:hypothetical protein